METHPCPPVSHVCLCDSGQRVGRFEDFLVNGCSYDCLFCFFFCFLSSKWNPFFLGVFMYLKVFFYYCKYRNCNPVIKWNMTDFSQKWPLYSLLHLTCVTVCPETDLSSDRQDQHTGLLHVQQVYGIVCSLLPLSLDMIYSGGKPGWQTLQLFTDIYSSANWFCSSC